MRNIIAHIYSSNWETYKEFYQDTESLYTAIPSITGMPAMVTKGVQLIADSYKDNVLLSIAKSVEGLEA